jgi:hypothetical protein
VSIVSESVPQAKAPFLYVLDYKVVTHPTLDVVMAVVMHEGQSFNLYMEADTALGLAGELEAAYQRSQAALAQLKTSNLNLQTSKGGGA